MKGKNIVEIEKFYNKCIISPNKLTTPVLYYSDKNGRIRMWYAVIILYDNSLDESAWLPMSFESAHKAAIYTHAQLEGGKLSVSSPTRVVAGKNIGRISETTPLQQAISEVMSTFNKKVNSGAVTSRDEIKQNMIYDDLLKRDIINPQRVKVMLLHNVNEHWNRVVYPCYVQSKLDGEHMVVTCAYEKNNAVVDLYSRGLTKNIAQNHIREAMSFITSPEWRGWYVTGEMWNKDINRQNLMSTLGQENDSNITCRINLNVFDAFNFNSPLMPFSERLEWARKIVATADSKYIKMVDTRIVNTKEDLEKYYNHELEIGHEGVIIRNTFGLYEYGITKDIRSYNTLKYKPRKDGEYMISGFKDGKGASAGAIIFIATCDGGNFSIVPSWPIIQRREAFLNGNQYIGRWATIEYDTLSDKNIPQQPVLKAFRDMTF